MRRSTVHSQQLDFSTPFDNTLRRELIELSLPYSSSAQGQTSSITEAFLRDSAKVAQMNPGAFYVNLAEVPPPLFASRLLIVLNNWYQLTLAHRGAVFYGDNPANHSVYGFDFGRLPANGSVAQEIINASCRLMCTRSTVARVTQAVEVFAYSRLWLALLLASAVVLQATGLGGMALGWRTRVPDVLGYVASMTYNNPFLPLPDGGGVLDAMERARVLRDLRVWVSDVRGGDDVGRIAFTSDADARGLEQGRLYV
jgi:hypothetical protein